MDTSASEIPKKTKSSEKIARGVVIGLAMAIVMGWLMSPHGSSNSYPASYATNFINSCTAQGASQTRCACLEQQVQSHYTYAQAQQFDQQAANGVTPPELTSLTSYCSQ